MFHMFFKKVLNETFHEHGSKHVSNNVGRDFRRLLSAFTTVAWESFHSIFIAKINYPIGHFMLPLLMLT